MGSFTTDEMTLAKSVDLCEIAESLGYHVKRVGACHTLSEMDSIRIYDRRTWYRWSDQTGGSQIDFLRVFQGIDFKDAMWWLLDFAGYDRTTGPSHREYNHIRKPESHPEKPKVFTLPPPAQDNRRIIQYLTEQRGIRERTVEQFIRAGLIYEEEGHHNLVFIGRDAKDVPRFASMRGLYDRNGKAFKCDVAGSDKSYGFHYRVSGSDTIRVFEGAIDLMSFYDATGETSDHLLALGMTDDKPLRRFLQENEGVTSLILCLDNDEPGRKAAERIEEKYTGLGFQVINIGSPRDYKDYNEWLQNKDKKVTAEPAVIL